jgi:hypothetical protein
MLCTEQVVGVDLPRGTVCRSPQPCALRLGQHQPGGAVDDPDVGVQKVLGRARGLIDVGHLTPVATGHRPRGVRWPPSAAIAAGGGHVAWARGEETGRTTGPRTKSGRPGEPMGRIGQESDARPFGPALTQPLVNDGFAVIEAERRLRWERGSRGPNRLGPPGLEVLNAWGGVCSDTDLRAVCRGLGGGFIPAQPLGPVVTERGAACHAAIPRLQGNHPPGPHPTRDVVTIHRHDGHVTPRPAGDGFPPASRPP